MYIYVCMCAVGCSLLTCCWTLQCCQSAGFEREAVLRVPVHAPPLSAGRLHTAKHQYTYSHNIINIPEKI